MGQPFRCSIACVPRLYPQNTFASLVQVPRSKDPMVLHSWALTQGPDPPHLHSLRELPAGVNIKCYLYIIQADIKNRSFRHVHCRRQQANRVRTRRPATSTSSAGLSLSSPQCYSIHQQWVANPNLLQPDSCSAVFDLWRCQPCLDHP